MWTLVSHMWQLRLCDCDDQRFSTVLAESSRFLVDSRRINCPLLVLDADRVVGSEAGGTCVQQLSGLEVWTPPNSAVDAGGIYWQVACDKVSASCAHLSSVDGLEFTV